MGKRKGCKFNGEVLHKAKTHKEATYFTLFSHRPPFLT